MTKCDDCGKEYGIGQWYACPHDPVQPRKGFEPYWDYHIAKTPQWIQTAGDRKKHLKPRWDQDHVIHTQERD